MNTTLKASLELADIRPTLVAQVAHATAGALTRVDRSVCGFDGEHIVLTVRFDSLCRAEAERTRDCVVGAIKPLVKRVIGTHLEVRP